MFRLQKREATQSGVVVPTVKISMDSNTARRATSPFSEMVSLNSARSFPQQTILPAADAALGRKARPAAHW